MSKLPPSAVAACALAASTLTSLTSVVSAQEVRVDYPDSALETPLLRFPFYTLGSGGTVRYQTMCPSTFAGLPSQPMLATRVGLQIAGQAHYTRFEIRFGTVQRNALAFDWTTNLPNQRLQVDLSNTVLPGGLQSGVPTNKWVELDLEYPVAWSPGQSLTIDILASAASIGSWCMTAVAPHERLYAAPYTGQPTGVLVPDEAIKLRIVFEPLGFPTYGQGCPGSGGFRPAIGASGSSKLGGSFSVSMSNARGASPTGLLFGLSRRSAPFGALPLSLGGGCSVLTSMEVSIPVAASGVGAGNGTASLTLPVPSNPSLLEAVLFAQWLLLDGGSAAVLPITTSDGAIVVVH
jgi:hypothetical protein